jgi:hypothetical protein
MLNNIGYKKSKKWAIKTYIKIPDTMCPVLNNEIIRFNAVGFRHLMRKGEERSHRVQKFRFSLISYAPRIVADIDVQVTHRIKELADGTIVKFWGLEKEYNGRKIRVVVRQKGNGVKHFYSVMEHTSKNPVNDEMF